MSQTQNAKRDRLKSLSPTTKDQSQLELAAESPALRLAGTAAPGTTGKKPPRSVEAGTGNPYEPQPARLELARVLPIARTSPDLPHSGLVEAILKVGAERKALMGDLRSALMSGNDKEALYMARRLCGLGV